MTVRELIALLQQQENQDVEVWHGEKRLAQVTIVERCRIDEEIGHFVVMLDDDPPSAFERAVVLIR